MAEFINKEELLDYLQIIPIDLGYREVEEIKKYIKEMPTIPVEQCADCKWFQCNIRGDGYLPIGVPEFECRHWCGEIDPVDFCSYGEPRRGDAE